MEPDPTALLVRGVNWLGDAVMTTPALQRLREARPDSRITLLTHEKLADLWRHHPSLDAVISFGAGESPWSIARRLRAQAFHTVLLLPNSPRSALEAWLARIPHRIGYARPWRNWLLTQPISFRPGHVRMHKRSLREIHRLVGHRQSASPLDDADHGTRNTHHAPVAPKSDEGGSRITLPPSAHQTLEYLRLAAALGASPQPAAPQLVVMPEEIEAAKVKFNLRAGPSGARPFFGLMPGAEYGPAKRWPADRFGAAAREIRRQTDCVWLVLGGQPDVPAAGEIARALTGAPGGFHNLAGKTSLRELMALLKLCRLLLTNDTGPMHVAAALGTPVVAPFGSTAPELTAPGLPGDPRHHILTASAPCAPCFRRACPIDFRCMTGITVERVIAAVLQVAAEQAE